MDPVVESGFGRMRDPDCVSELLKLPDDLTPYTKMVLNKIFKKFKNELQAYEDTVRIFMTKQKAEMKQYIESLVSSAADEPNMDNETALHLTGIKQENEQEQEPELEPEHDTHSENPQTSDANLCCPHKQPDIRQKFTNNIRELNHILESLLCKEEEEIEPPGRSRNIVDYDCTIYPPIRHNLAAPSCPHRYPTRSITKKIMS